MHLNKLASDSHQSQRDLLCRHCSAGLHAVKGEKTERVRVTRTQGIRVTRRNR